VCGKEKKVRVSVHQREMPLSEKDGVETQKMRKEETSQKTRLLLVRKVGRNPTTSSKRHFQGRKNPLVPSAGEPHILSGAIFLVNWLDILTYSCSEGDTKGEGGV